LVIVRIIVKDRKKEVDQRMLGHGTWWGETIHAIGLNNACMMMCIR
jgi:hypothetical protein